MKLASSSLIERSLAKDRNVDAFDRPAIAKENAAANERHGQARFAAPFEKESRGVEGIDDIRGLQLVEPTPHGPTEADQHLCPVATHLKGRLVHPENRLGRLAVIAAGFNRQRRRQTTSDQPFRET